MSADVDRRTVLAALASLPLSSSTSMVSEPVEPHLGASATLVAYFTRSGNTRVIAGVIHRALKTDLFEIRPSSPYPDDYLETVDQAHHERDNRIEPPLASSIPDIGRYTTIYLGFPIWGETVPPVVRSFLASHGVAGKTLIPFITHGGYGAGNSQLVLGSHAPGAKIERAFVMEADQERRTMEQVLAWLDRPSN